MVIHIAAVIVIFIIVKLCFKGDFGDYYIGTYVSVLILITTFRVMNDSDPILTVRTSFMDISISKYQKSSLTETGKMRILDKYNS